MNIYKHVAGRILLSISLGLALPFISIRAQAEEYPIRVNIIRPGFLQKAVTVEISNESLAPYVVLVKIFNDSEHQELVAQTVSSVDGKSKFKAKVEPNQGMSIGERQFWHADWRVGRTKIDPIDVDNFSIPFDKNIITNVCQSPDGPITSHVKTPLSIDFCVPLKTPVLAAKSGQVIEAISKFTEGGPSAEYTDKANKVYILHADGLISKYVHFYPGSVTVRVGDNVKQGDMLGLVGLTGQTSGPHLHFDISYLNDAIEEVFVSPHFKNQNGEPILIKYQSRLTRESNPTNSSEQMNRSNLVEANVQDSEAFPVSMESSFVPASNLKSQRILDICPSCFQMISIPAGTFPMGETGSTRPIKIRKFEIGKTEVTQREWRLVMGTNPSVYAKCGDNCPVDNVSWGDVQDFMARLNSLTGRHWRLPSESEWEYACRAGSRTRYCGSDILAEVGWYGAFSKSDGNSEQRPSAVGAKRPNGWGIYDMSGGVWEWVQDCWNSDSKAIPQNGQSWEVGGCEQRGLRGGSWENVSTWALASTRYRVKAIYRSRNLGFRLAQ